MLIRRVLARWLLVSGLWFSAAALGQETISFNRDIRPILSDNCFFCHGPDTNKREAGLRLDTLEGLHGTEGITETSTETSTGGKSSRQARAGVVVAGKPQASLLIERIETQDAELHMPPLESGKKLTAEQVELLKRWIPGWAVRGALGF